jgi:putative transposase
MYNWRKMTADERAEVLDSRKRERLPWHSPHHRASESGLYHVTAANFEHRPILGMSVKRLARFESKLLQTLEAAAAKTHAWCVLPNHYHLLLHAQDIFGVLAFLGKLHGRTSHAWNGEENSRGRQCWCKAVERSIRSERHYWATLNYVHHNPVRHGYVQRWQDWPFSSAARFLDEVGRGEAERIWREYPILDYGKDWDDPNL